MTNREAVLLAVFERCSKGIGRRPVSEFQYAEFAFFESAFEEALGDTPNDADRKAFEAFHEAKAEG